MKILAADDEILALEMLTDAIREVIAEAEIFSFQKPSEIIAFSQSCICDIAFLDINMYGITGIEIAQKLKKNMPGLNIIFVTGYDEYVSEAMAMHASGYIMKPVSADKIKREIDDLRYPVKRKVKPILKVRCFGNFDVYTPEGEFVHFERSKAKEVFAYLIYRFGSSCSIKEIAATIFEDREYDKKQQGYTQKIISSMIHTLKSVEAEKVIVKKYNSLAINVNLLDCDYYKFSKREKTGERMYFGEFMAHYSWAEFAIGYLNELYWEQDSLHL